MTIFTINGIRRKPKRSTQLPVCNRKFGSKSQPLTISTPRGSQLRQRDFDGKALLI
jgi:hypothetical protein